MKLLPIFASGALGGMMHSYSSPCDKVEYFLGSKANFKNEVSMKIFRMSEFFLSTDRSAKPVQTPYQVSFSV